jgi:hypothetical protein
LDFGLTLLADLETSIFRIALSRMSERPKPRPDEKESPVRRLKEAMNEMSIAELCDLMIDIQAKIREAARPPKADK